MIRKPWPPTQEPYEHNDEYEERVKDYYKRLAEYEAQCEEEFDRRKETENEQ